MPAQQPERYRPPVVTTVAVLLFLVAAFSALGGFGLLSVQGSAEGDDQAMLAARAMVLFVMALAYVLLGLFVLRGNPRGRIAVLIVMGIGVVLELLSFSAPDSFVTFGVGAVVIGILGWHPDAKKYFAGEDI